MNILSKRFMAASLIAVFFGCAINDLAMANPTGIVANRSKIVRPHKKK